MIWVGISACGLRVLSAEYSNPSLTILNLFNFPILLDSALTTALTPKLSEAPVVNPVILGNLS